MKQKFINLMHKKYQKIIPLLRKNRLLNFFLFGFIPKKNILGEYWDWTTLSIKKMLKKYFKKNMVILDVGTGPYGVLSLYSIVRLKAKHVSGIDINQELIDNVQQYNHEKNLSFFQSNLFENVENEFDIIIFNAPYIDINFGKEIGILKDDLSIKRWSGGKNGIEIIQRFLNELKPYLKAEGIVILGVNHFYIDDKLVRKSISDAKLSLLEIDKNRFTKACSYIIKK